MRLPYVIDNQHHRLAEVLNSVLGIHQGRSLDVASAYFTVSGFRLLREGLAHLGSFRLLLGAEPKSGGRLGLRPKTGNLPASLRHDLDDLPFDEPTLRLVEDLIAFLRRGTIQVRLHEKGFLHAKCWIFYDDRPGDRGLLDRFRPIAAIVGSSNFTGPGLSSNRELNLTHKVLLDPEEADDAEAADAVAWMRREHPEPNLDAAQRRSVKSEVGARAILDLERWYEERWADSRDFKDELVEVLVASKFGETEYTPYQIYLKALFEYFRDDLEGESLTGETRSAVELSVFQDDAVKKARRVLQRHHGVLVADSVGLGKTWIGKKLLEDYAYHQRMKALVICPASLRENWVGELRGATIAASVVSQEALGREEFDGEPYHDADVILIDESHNFRNPNTQRYQALERILRSNGNRGRDGGRKKVILLTATPINNDLLDLYYQLSLISIGDNSHFVGVGIGDLYRYFLRARRSMDHGGTVALFNLLEEVVVRRTRQFIRRAYPEATIRGEKVSFPERKLRTVNYDLEATYQGIYDDIVHGVESLRLAPYNLEAYKRKDEERDVFELGREQALVGIFKSRYLKRFESSIESFRISVRRALEFLKTFESYLLDGTLVGSRDFHKMARYVEREGEDDEATPRSLADELDEHQEVRQILDSLEPLDTRLYDLRRVHEAIQHDVEVLTEIWHRVKGIGPQEDAKLQRLKALLRGELRGEKVLIFSYFKDTARYLYRHTGHPDFPEAEAFRQELGGITIRRMDSGADPNERQRLVQGFAPRSNNRPEWEGTDREIQILFSTDVLSEGHNLQDCGLLINYDLHWNPTRMVQRAGRLDRIGSRFEEIRLYNMFPDEGLERLLGLVQSLNTKISQIDRAGFHDASIFGETVNPRNFNTLRRIREEDGSVIEEEEQFAELASSEVLAQQLQEFLRQNGREVLEALPDGIHSGMRRAGTRGAFFFFRTDSGEQPRHFWRFVDLREDRIIDNRHVIANLIACREDTPRHVDPDLWEQVFDLQERAIEDILGSVQQQVALERTAPLIDPSQKRAATLLERFMQHPDFDRQRLLEAVRFLNQPMVRTDIRALREVLRRARGTEEARELLKEVERLRQEAGASRQGPSLLEANEEKDHVGRDELRLVCFELLTDA